MLMRESHSVRREPIEVPWRLSHLRRLPGSFEKIPISQAHEYRIQRAGFQSRVAADVVPILPILRPVKKSVKNLERLW